MSEATTETPLVDLSVPGAAQAFTNAAASWGFVQIVQHGIPLALIDEVWKQTETFFALPREIKRQLLRSKENAMGYFDQELTKNKRDLKEIFDFGAVSAANLEAGVDQVNSGDGSNQWPESLPEFKRTMCEYFSACEQLGHRLLEMLSAGLGLPDDTFHPHFGDRHTGFMRLNYYPLDDPLAVSEAGDATPLGDMALHHHTDAGVLTVLLQDDAGGLEAQVDGEWLDVTPIEGALIINVGDMMQVWSNDRYPALLHRVRPVQGRSRYSIPFFLNPAYETDCTPLGGDPPRYRSINWGDFRRARSDGDYANLGKEIQIEDFRIR
ncbi:MAG: 2OG-Fe(II) oxygenase family protein [Planctomycetota bacterium]|nr:2OG-Fe(II) oxygenase family protein [Planctomycetota bacterium]